MIGQERPREDREAQQVDGVLLVELRVKVVLLLRLGQLLEKVVLLLDPLVPRIMLAAATFALVGRGL
jgi:hypothetical protein